MRDHREDFFARLRRLLGGGGRSFDLAKLTRESPAHDDRQRQPAQDREHRRRNHDGLCTLGDVVDVAQRGLEHGATMLRERGDDRLQLGATRHQHVVEDRHDLRGPVHRRALVDGARRGCRVVDHDAHDAAGLAGASRELAERREEIVARAVELRVLRSFVGQQVPAAGRDEPLGQIAQPLNACEIVCVVARERAGTLAREVQRDDAHRRRARDQDDERPESANPLSPETHVTSRI